MRLVLLMILLIVAVLGLNGCNRTHARTTAGPGQGAQRADYSRPLIPTKLPAATSASNSEVKPGPESLKIDFAAQVQPIFERKCQPCHFNGGKVYARMPFDRPETIRTLGTKLFTRIKDENDRQVIRAFLAQQ